MRTLAALSLIALLELLSPATQAAGLPLVISATVDYTHNTLTISGQNFGSNPAVTLDAMSFPAQSPSSSSQIIANFPSGKAASSFTPGTYFLTVTFKNQLPSIFGVALGANGAVGPAGPAGAPGAAGATGPAGPAGPQGFPGPFGPVGATGAAGATGAQGVAGPAGPQGLQGATGATGAVGPQGTTGANGTNGTGAPICAASDTVVSYQGALVCKSTLPRYIDNGDGTVTDNQTGLMWEKKFDGSLPIICSIGNPSCPPDPIHDVNNTYSWSSTGTLADGTLFTTFIAELNGGDYYSPSAGLTVGYGPGSCFANHCDWRIPSIGELQGILLTPFPCTPCIDPAFGPTQASDYWSSSTVWINTSYAWGIYFGGGRVSSPKGNNDYARAVRSGR
jgi:hypothetical protein